MPGAVGSLTGQGVKGAVLHDIGRLEVSASLLGSRLALSRNWGPT